MQNMHLFGCQDRRLDELPVMRVPLCTRQDLRMRKQVIQYRCMSHCYTHGARPLKPHNKPQRACMLLSPHRTSTQVMAMSSVRGIVACLAVHLVAVHVKIRAELGRLPGTAAAFAGTAARARLP